MPATSASLLGPVFLIMDATGNIYFSVGIFGNCVYKISAADGTLTRIAGSGVQDFWGDGGPATSAGINEPQGLALDAAGNLYIADLGNHRIRKVSATTGIISTVAGSGSYNYSGDGGPATAAGMSILDLAVDATGNIYFSDFSNDRIRKIASGTGIITTVAGTGLRGNSGDGGMAVNAKLYLPFGVKLASNGDVYFADAANNSIRKITLATGIITTVAGNGYAGYTGDGLHATAYSLIFPYGIAIDSKNNIYVGDNGNARIRKVAAQ
jgi:sugar lactone lactonase YvrE